MKLLKPTDCIVVLQKKSPFLKLVSSLGLLLILSCSLLAQDWNWKTFSPANKAWQILAPGPLMPDAEAQNPKGNKGTYAYSDFNGFFAVIWRDSPRRWVPWKPDYNAYLKKQRDDVVRANRGEILKDVEFSHQGLVGREVHVKFQAGTMTGVEGQTMPRYRVQRFRMFFLGTRFYVVLTVLPESIIDTPPIDKYLDSFSAARPPTAVGNSYSVDEDGTLTVNASTGVLANDTDVQNLKLSVSGSKPVVTTTNGSLSLNGDGSFTYKPNPNFNGKDTFTYQANNGSLESDIAMVTITINPVNDAPTLADVPPTTTADELTKIGFKATGNDIDSPASSLRYSLTGAPAEAAIDPQTGVFSWTPTEAQGPGNYTFKVNLSDGQASTSATMSVTVNEVNVAPQISSVPAASAPVNELEPYTFNIKALDTDLPAQALTYSLAGAPEGAAINPTTGVFSWTPTEAQGDGSTYRFTVRVSDGYTSAEAPITLIAKEVNSAPVLLPISDQTLDELKSLSVTAKGADTDIPTNTLTYSLEGAPAGMTINSQTGEISWTPTEEQGPANYSVTVRVTDNGSPALSSTRAFNVHVNEVNSAPKLNPIGNKTADEETLLSFKVSANDTDLPANTLTYSLVNGPAGATLNSSTGVFNWTPTEAQGPGDFTMTVRVTDSGSPALSDEQTITIKVNEVNKPPVVNDITLATDEDAGISFVLRGTDADLPSNTLRYSIVSPPAHGKISGNAPDLIYKPDPDYNGADKLTFKANDGSTDSNTATVYVTVKPINDPPVAVPDSMTTDEGVPVTFNILANDRDVDGDRLVLTGFSNVVNGKAEIVGGEAKFTPASGFNGTASFNYTVSDGKGGTATGSVTVKVNPAKPKQ